LFVFFNFRKYKDIFDFSILFNLLAFIYFFLGLNIYQNLYGQSNLLIQISYDCLLALLSFNLAYYLFNFKRKIFKLKIWKPDKGLILFFFYLTVFIELYSFFERGGLINRTDAFYFLNNNKYLFLNKTFQFILYFLISSSFFSKDDKNYSIYAINTFILILLSFVNISRFEIFNILLINIYFVYLYRGVRLRSLLIYSSLVTFLFLALKPLLYLLLLNQTYADNTLNYSEIINWIRNTYITLNSTAEYPYNSYLVTLEGMINPFISSEKPLSNWYMQTFFYSDYLNGNKYGFSSLAEGYMNGNRYYNILSFAFLGFLFKYVNDYRKDVFGIFLKLIFITIMYKLFRSELYNFFRSLIYIYILPYLIIYLISYLFSNNTKEVIFSRREN